MATIRFNLKDKKNTPQTIRLIFRHNGKKIIYYTPFKVYPKYWNVTKGRVKNITTVTDKDKINIYLNEIETALKKWVTDQQSKNETITTDKAKEFLNIYTGKTEQTPKTLFLYIDNFIQKAPQRLNISTGKPVSYKMIREYKRTFFYLQEFSKRQNKNIDFKDINLDFYEDFTTFLKSKKLATNTIGKKIQTLKIFLNSATEKGINTNLSYKNPRFKAITEESETVYLNETELNKIHNLDLTNRPKLDKVKDLFLVGCWTGLRFSDLSKLTPDNIKGDLIEIEQQKTGNKVFIPLHPIVKEILNKYNGVFPQSISNQRFNEYIKEVCKLAGIDTPEHKAITKGGIKQSKKYKKYELVTSHTARRSFATNLYKSGFPAISIMQITGHKTEKAFLKYIKVTPEEHAKLLALHWNKNKQHLKIV